MPKRKKKTISVQGCKCGVNHNAPGGQGAFGLSFQDGTHPLYIEKEVK